MEPIQRRSFNGGPQRRPVMNDFGVAPHRVAPIPGVSPAQPAHQQPMQPLHAAGPPPVAHHTAAPSALQPLQSPAATAQPAQAVQPQVQPHSFSPHHAPNMAQPAQQRPMQPAQPHSVLQPQPVAPVQSAQQSPLQPQTASPVAAQPTPAATGPQPVTPAARPFGGAGIGGAGTVTNPASDDQQQTKGHKMPHPTGHAGLVGFAVFLVCAVITLAPFVPGKIWDTAPGSSQSFSSGDQAIACASDVTNSSVATKYDTKLGAPFVYSYSTTSTLSGSCKGVAQHVTGGHTAQFNPLGLAIDFAIALAAGIVTAKIWRRFKGTE